VLDRLDLSDRFDAVVCCTDETGWKPDPDPIELAMTDLDVNPQSDRGYYYVGDGESDVRAAWNAGLDAVHVERVGHEDRGRCVLGDRRVSRLDELFGRRLAESASAGAGRPARATGSPPATETVVRHRAEPGV